MRLFVAVELTDAWRRAARDARTELELRLPAEAVAALRWVDPALLHLTLRFLGEFPDGGVERLNATLAHEVGWVDLALESQGLGGFGGRNRIQVVWLGVGGDLDRLRSLVERVERACVAAGARPEPRPFAPHITLARVRERASVDARRATAAAVEATPAPLGAPLSVRHVALVRSTLGAGAPRYNVESRHPPEAS